jgi:sorbitol-specific phosphotransferase system component IIA
VFIYQEELNPMKKSITLFIIVAILIVSASFAFTSCDSSSNGINPNGSSNTSLPDTTAKPDGTTQNDQNGTVDDSGNNENNNSHTHSFGEWSVVQAATCTQNGVEEAICSCGEKITKTLANLGHIFEKLFKGKYEICSIIGGAILVSLSIWIVLSHYLG